MAKQKSDAGAAVVQPDPSRTSSLFDGSRPLQLFLQNLDQMRLAMTASGIASFAFSPLNVLPKLALGKMELQELSGGLILSDAETDRVIPTGDQSDYWQTLTYQLGKRRKLALVPEVYGKHLGGAGYKSARQQIEYLMKTDDVITPPGGRHGRLRNYLRQAERDCLVEEFDPANVAEYLAVNKTWYRQNAELKFRTYDKTSIDWLLNNWQAVQQAVPDARCVGIRTRHTAQLIAFDMGCLLTKDQWTSYTHRFDRNAPVNRVSMFAYAELAKLYPACPTENQGTADTTTIKAWKERLAYATQTLFTVSR